MGAVFLRKYNTLTVTGTTAIRIPIIKRGVVDFAVGADWTPASGDVVIWKNGTAANVTNLPTAVNSGNCTFWEFILTAAELSVQQAIIVITDSATKAVEDSAFIVETFGHASAMYQWDMSLANLPVNVIQLLGTAWLTPAVAGTPDVNAKQVGGTSQTARDLGASVLLSPGTGTGQLDVTSGVVKANLVQILGTLLTETAGQIAAAFKQFFNIATPTSTMNRITLVDTTTANSDMRGTDGANTTTPPAAAAIAIAVEAAILDEGDATALLAAIGAKVEEFLINEGDATAMIAAIATACNAAIAAGTVGTNAAAAATSAASADGKATTILADTNELQTDWANGGRLDLIVDAVKAKTDQLAFTVANQVDANALTGGGGLDAAGVRGAVGLADANLDDQLTNIADVTDQFVFTVANKVDATATATVDEAAIAEAVWTNDERTLTAGAGEAGSGARTVVITVNDGVAALEVARVRVTQGAENYIQSTDIGGQATFNLDDATWTVAITKAGYLFAGASLVVNGDEAQTYSMTLVSITPSDPGATTGYATIRTSSGDPIAGVVVQVQVTKFANGTTGSGIDDPLASGTTDINGLVEFVGLPRLATYRVRIGTGAWFTGVTLDAASTPLAGVLGLAE